MSAVRIVYLTHARLPTEKAYGVQMANTVYHMAKQGAEVVLVNSNRDNLIKKDFFSYYKIPESALKIRSVPSLQIFIGSRVGFWLNMLSFSLFSLHEVYAMKPDIIYSREPFPLLFLSWFGFRTVYEMHDFPISHHWFHRLLCRSVGRIVITNTWAQNQCVEQYRIPMKKIILAPNGYDEEKFTGKLSKAESRMYVGLPSESTIVMYTGSLYTWKGVDVLVEVAKKLPQHTFVLVGGATEEHRVLRGTTPPNNVLFIEHQSPDVIPFYLASADVLVLPNVPTTQHSTYSTSPIKLFEYMASRRLVVASRLPSITSLVSEDEVVFAEPGDVEDWGNKLNEVLRQPELFAHKVEQAMRLVQQYSWDNRAKKIIRMVYS